MAFQEYLLGKRTRLSWVKETSFATGGNMASDGEVLGLNAVIEPDFNQNWQEILSDGTAGRTVDGFELGPLDLPFTLSFTPTNWKLLRHCGYGFTNTGGSAPYTHTGTLQNAIQSFRLEWAILHTTPVVVTLAGCTVLNATINFSKGSGDGESMITVTLNCVAKTIVSINSSVTTLASGAVTRPPFHFRNVRITKNDVEVVEVNNGEITIDQGIDPNDSRYCNASLAREIGEPISKVHRLSGRFNMNIKNNTEFNQWNAGLVIDDCSLEFVKGAEDYLTLGLDGFRVAQGLPPTTLDGIMNTDVVWRCEKFDPIVAEDDLDDY